MTSAGAWCGVPDKNGCRRARLHITPRTRSAPTQSSGSGNPGVELLSSTAHTCAHRFRCESHCAAVVRLIRSSQIGSMDRMCPGAATSG
jgi:hypothetical protein